ncbi:MAG: oxygen-dependent coproporphyrinogen oxidase [Flavobacteriales bacterium]|nr:oxygen-dependent coproporphyrinogen oxidase [Flavobacteriales bacterium]
MDIADHKEAFSKHVYALQEEICKELKRIDPSIVITEDNWKREDFKGNEGGGGRTRAITGKFIENAGVNCSTIYGELDPKFASSLNTGSTEIWATGISLIIHPYNPKCPTVHANFRLIQSGEKFWLGGGADLTPYYPYENDFVDFHNTWAKACEPYGVYNDFKKTCDEYFVNYHRDDEMRGIGGIFFDHFNSGDFDKDVEMSISISKAFIASYFPILERRLNEAYNEADEDFQLHRRGRYVEFNLLHDRGTIFGLKTKGRTSSILISLPGRCKFTYEYAPVPGSPHEKMMAYYRPKDWLGKL